MRPTTRLTFTAAIAAIFSMLLANLAYADQVTNSLDNTVDDTVDSAAEEMAVTAGGTNSTTIWVANENTNKDGDTVNSCNLAGTASITLDVLSSDITKASLSPSSITIEDCDLKNGKTVTVTGVAAGSSTISFRVNGTPPAGSWNYDTATFVAKVSGGDACASVSAPATPIFSAGSPDGSNGWFRTVPSAEATTTTTDATMSYSTDGTNFSATAPTLGQGTTTVTAKATSATCNKTSTASREFKVDTVAPTVTPGDVTNSTWRNTSLSQDFTSSDGTSELANAGDSSFTLTASSESANSTTPTVVQRTVTDNAGNSTTRSVSALIDLTRPTISGAASPAVDGDNGWYKTAPTVTFTCSDGLSGLDSCLADGETTSSKTLGEDATAQTVSGTAIDNVGNQNTASVSGLKVDLSDPTNVSFVGGPADGSSYYYGSSLPAAPTCTADDAVSGLGDCRVTGYSTAVGTHTMTATATDNAGRTATATRTYTVLAWTLKGFYSPVDMGSTLNSAKSGSTVPLKFEVFAGSTELTDTSVVSSFRVGTINCGELAGTPTDDIEQYSTGGTSLRYDSTAGQFIQNWQTPKGQAGTCYKVTMTTADGSSISAFFKLK